MDLSFQRFDKDTQVSALPHDLAVLLVGVAARQAASPTASVQARLATTTSAEALFAPRHGAFNAAMAAMLKQLESPVNAAFTERLQPFFKPGG